MSPRKKDESLFEEELEDAIEQEEDALDEEEYEDDDAEVAEYEDDEDEYEYEEESRRTRLIPMAVMAAAVLSFVSLGWYAYDAGVNSVANEELLLVEAEQTPMKERPLEPGGLQFPYQDKSVFETITADARAADTPEVISSIEEPLMIEPQTSGLQEQAEVAEQDFMPADANQEVIASIAPESDTRPDTRVESAFEPVIAEVVPEAAPVEKPTEKPAVVVETPETPEPVAKPAAPIVKAESKPAPAPKTPSATEVIASSSPASGGGSVQLGAYRSDADARAAWQKISGDHAVLSGLSPQIIRADLGEKGVYHRLRVAGVDAATTCATLKTNGQACITVK